MFTENSLITKIRMGKRQKIRHRIIKIKRRKEERRQKVSKELSNLLSISEWITFSGLIIMFSRKMMILHMNANNR